MDQTRIKDDITELEKAAQAGDTSKFILLQKRIDWSKRPPEDFIEVIRLALTAGANQSAREISAAGTKQFPYDDKLRKYAHLLAPAKAVRSEMPPDPTIKANRDWLMAHGSSYRGQWVALRNGELLGAAPILQNLLEFVGDTKGIMISKAF